MFSLFFTDADYHNITFLGVRNWSPDCNAHGLTVHARWPQSVFWPPVSSFVRDDVSPVKPCGRSWPPAGWRAIPASAAGSASLLRWPSVAIVRHVRKTTSPASRVMTATQRTLPVFNWLEYSYHYVTNSSYRSHFVVLIYRNMHYVSFTVHCEKQTFW